MDLIVYVYHNLSIQKDSWIASSLELLQIALLWALLTRVF